MVTDSSKEVRFTRARQAIVWLILASCGCVGILALVLCQFLPAPFSMRVGLFFWVLLCMQLVFVFLTVKVALRCLRHAYLIFSPVGVEIFPWKKPEKNLDVVLWGQIDHMEMRNQQLYIHFNAEQTAGKVISLKPIFPKQHYLIERIINERTKS